MNRKYSVPAIVLSMILVLLCAAAMTVAAQELSISGAADSGTEERESLWDISAGVATIINPSVEYASEEETSRALENAVWLTQSDAEDETAVHTDIVMSDADFTLDVVAEPGEDAEVVGFLYEDCGGRVIEHKDGWTLIQSGDLVGWAQDEYLAFDEKAEEMAAEAGQSIVVVEAGVLRARIAPEEGAEVVTLLTRGEELDYIEDVNDEWIAADFNNEVIYVASAFVSKDFSIDVGETVEEIEAREELRRREEERKAEEAALLEEAEAKKLAQEQQAMEEAKAAAEEAALKAQLEAEAAAAAQVQSVTVAVVAENSLPQQETGADAAMQALEAQAALEAAQKAAATQAAAAAATPDDIRLLGALIYCEAGNQSYEGKVAVGAVVMNRVKSGSYPNTINGVIRASGQFTPVRSGKVDRVYANGVPDECMLAAQEALAGVSPVGEATHFRRNNGRAGQVLGAHVFY